MSVSRRVLLISGDLLATSRLAPACRDAGIDLVVAARMPEPAASPAFDAVVVDLQSVRGSVTDQVAAARPLTAAAGLVLAFGPHVWKDELAAAAAAGADAVVSRGEALGDLPGLLERARTNRP